VVTPDNQATTKIRRVGPSLLGRTGWGVYDNILEDLLARTDEPDLGDRLAVFRFFTRLWGVLHKDYAFVNDQAKRKDSPFGDLGGSFLVAGPGGIFYTSSNLGVTQFHQYFAIGSGADYSLGALHSLYDTDDDAPTLAHKAVETAIAFNVHCGNAIQTETTPARP
jgi:hypothetical protein